MVLGGTTVDAGSTDVDSSTELITLFKNLLGELSGWSNDKTNWTVTSLKWRLSVDMPECGHQESQSFTTTSFGDTNHIVSFQSNGPTLCLNWGWFLESHSIELV